MKKKFLFIVGAMLFMLVGTVLTACSSDNDVDTVVITMLILQTLLQRGIQHARCLNR